MNDQENKWKKKRINEPSTIELVTQSTYLSGRKQHGNMGCAGHCDFFIYAKTKAYLLIE